MEKKPESSNIENASEPEEKSSSLPRHDVPETSIVQASPNMEDNIKEHTVIHFMKVESESLNTENFSDEKSSFSTLKHDVPETYIEKASNSEAYDSQPSQSDIMEESKSESTNVEKTNEFDEKSSSPSITSHDVPETSIEQVPSNQEDFVSQPSQSDITEEQPKSTNVEKNNEFDEKSSSPSITSHDVPETSIEQIPSKQEDFISQPFQSDVTEEQPKSTNVDKNNEFDEKSSSPSITSHDVPETSKQALSNQEDFVIIFSQPSQFDITAKQPESTNIEINNVPDEKLSSPSIPKHDVRKISCEPASPILEDYIRNSLHSYFSSFLEDQFEFSNIYNSSKFKKLSIPENPRIMIILFPDLFSNDNQSSQECIQKNKSDNKSKENQDERGLSNSDSYATVNEQPITSKSAIKLKFSALQECNRKNESDTKSTDNQYKKEEKHRSIVDMIKSFRETSSTRPSPTKPSEDGFVKDIPPKLTTTGEVQEDEKPKKLRCKIKRRPKYSSKFCLPYLLSFIFSSILFLSPCIFPYLLKFYIHSGLVRMDKNNDTFATAVVEVEEGILNHDATIRALSEYLERDEPLLKVVALIGDRSVGKTYTVDIIKKRLRNKRSTNDCLPSLPRFVVLENLRAEHSTIVIDYIKTYQEEYGNREFLILAVYKVEQIDDDLTHADINHVINTVKDTFIKANVMVKIIPFKPLTEDVLEKYIL